MGEYTPETWVEGAAPGISAARLNNIEAGVLDAHEDLGAHIDFALDEDVDISLLTTSFADIATFTYTPPTAWGDYKILSEVQAQVQGFGATTDVHLVLRVDGVDGSDFEFTVVTSTSTFPGTVWHHRNGRSGPIDVILRARVEGGAPNVNIRNSFFKATAVQES